jgi:hypothetical protein
MPTPATTADDEVVSMHEQYYIQATSSRADDRTRVLKHDETFAVFDRFAICSRSAWASRASIDGTRFLSRLELRIGGRRPLMLSSTVKKENDLLTVDLAPDLRIRRARSCWRAGRCTSSHQVPVAELLLRTAARHALRHHRGRGGAGASFSADYADIFEVRGANASRGSRLSRSRARVTLGYEGLPIASSGARGWRSIRARRSERRAGAVSPAAALARHATIYLPAATAAAASAPSSATIAPARPSGRPSRAARWRCRVRAPGSGWTNGSPVRSPT